MIVVETQYFGPTVSKGARIRARWNGRRKIVSKEQVDSGGPDISTHQAAADLLVSGLGRQYQCLGGGYTKTGYAFLYKAVN